MTAGPTSNAPNTSNAPDTSSAARISRPPDEASAWAPFRHRIFFWLWLGVLISSVGSWAQTVGAQWLFVSDPNADTIVPLVQSANALPVMLLALPAGVFADVFDRRWLLFVVQVYFIVVGVTLAVLTALGLMPAALLLAFTFAVGLGMAVQTPTWMPLIAELMPRSSLAAATRLDMVNVNLARAGGPALAGLIIAHWGVPDVFALNAASVVPLAVVLLVWRRAPSSPTAPERFLPALRAGGRYVRHEPVVRLILTRLAMFIAPATALWALLPLIANHQLGLDAGGYGLLFTALGVGAVLGAMTLGRVKRSVSSNALLGMAGLAFAATFALTVVVPNVWSALPVLVVAGFGWTATVSTLNAELQLFLPGWVRARAIAVYLMTFTGAQAIASPIWGLVTRYAGLSVAVWTASALVAAGCVAGLVMRVPESEHLDRSPLVYWGDAPLAVEPEAGPIVVSVEYDVPLASEAAFLAAMEPMRSSRLRSGGTRWEVYRVAEQPGRFVEMFTLASWDEHQRQHDGRLTAADKAVEDAAFAFAVGVPHARHLVPPTPDSSTLDSPSPDSSKGSA